MAWFGLVHGAWGVAAAWRFLVPALERRGHRAVAVQLPADDPDAGAERYAEAVVAALAEADEAVVLVGHSMGGLTIPLVPARRPVARLVYLCAFLPDPGRSMADRWRSEPVFSPEWPAYQAQQVSFGDGSSVLPPEAAVPALFHDLPRDLARAEAEGLRRQHWRPAYEVTPLERWPDTPVSWVLTTGDRCVSPAWQEAVAGSTFGVAPIRLDGGHQPMQAQPDRLADVLDDLARRSD